MKNLSTTAFKQANKEIPPVKSDWRDYLTGKPIFDMTDAGAPWRDGPPEGLTGERELPTSPPTDEPEELAWRSH